MTVQYVRPDGSYVGGFGDGALPTERDAHPVTVDELINIGEDSPEYADQIYLFPGWEPSRLKQTVEESRWRESEITAISNQLMALEESEAGSEDAQPMAGTRSQWLVYRTKVRAWKEGNVDFPDQSKRPTRPS